MHITAPGSDIRVDLDAVDLCDSAAYSSACQHATWQTMRAESPARLLRAPNGTPFWSFAGYDECSQIIKDHRRFSSRDGTILASVGVGDAAGGETITLMDPPDHTQIRRATSRPLRNAVLRQRAEMIREQVSNIVRRCVYGETVDVVPLIRPLPMAAVGDLLGISPDHWETIAFYATASIAPDDPTYARGETQAGTLRRAHHELFSCFSEAIAAKRETPGDDLISALLTAEINGRRMEDSRIALNCYSMLLGANSTTPHVVTQTLLALAERPEVWQQVWADRSLIPALVDEGARWTTPTHHLVRRTRVATELGGVRLRPGDWVCAWVASANRDSSVFDAPYEFRIDRAPNPHLAFGAGPHYCVGAPSSRIMLAAFFEELAASVRTFEVAGPVAHLHSNWINGLTALPLTFRGS